jgi:hypothetical protein
MVKIPGDVGRFSGEYHAGIYAPLPNFMKRSCRLIRNADGFIKVGRLPKKDVGGQDFPTMIGRHVLEYRPHRGPWNTPYKCRI